jgi:phage shock protein A
MTELSRAKRSQAQLSQHVNELRRQLGACEQRLKEVKAKIRDPKD